MPKSTKKIRRYPVEKDPHPFLTTAEARAEAGYMVLQALLKRIPPSICKGVMADCYSAADSLQIDAITEEVECIFSNVSFDSPMR